MLSPHQRRRFDRLLDEVVADLPANIQELFEEVPVLIEDEPSRRLKREMDIADDEDLCGVHRGVPLTERSVDGPPELPSQILLFRGPIMRQAAQRGGPELAAIREEIRITLLHEVGHHYGLNEEDLDELGYG